MGKLVTVTLETDGLCDYVRLPSGERYNLGAVSVLRLVASLVTDRRKGRLAIENFNRSGKAVVPLDPEAMLAFLEPRPTRRASFEDPLISSPQHKPSSTEGTNMSDVSKRTLDLRLSHIEHAIREMNDRVASGAPVSERYHATVHRAAISLPDFGDQSKNKAFYGLGEPEVDTVEDGGYVPSSDVTHPLGKTAASRNADVAERILTKVAATSDKIDALVAAGRRFNASKAQRDLHKIATEVHEILSNADLTDPSVANYLSEVATKAARIHDLFVSVR